MKTQLESSKLEFFRPDAFNFINSLKMNPPEKNLINLSIGAPNRATPEWILNALKRNLDNPAYHTYPPQFGSNELIGAVRYWYQKRYNVNLDSKKNILITVGVKEAIFNSFHALINMGDSVLLADPGYPTYFEAAAFTGAKSIFYNSDVEEGEAYTEISDKIKTYQPKLLVLNYPSNPTGRTVSLQFYKKINGLCKEYEVLVMSDVAYGEIGFDEATLNSYLETWKDNDLAIEYFSFSKTYNMAGWRVGAIVGEGKIINAIKLYKSKIDSNVFYPLQLAAVSAIMETPNAYYQELRKMYQERRDILIKGANKAGLKYTLPKGSFYFWLDIPQGIDSWRFVEILYKKYGILGVPGTAYGNNGRKKIRLACVQEAAIMEEASDRISKINF
jgi:LL-diaminopimelate aminotransferase